MRILKQSICLFLILLFILTLSVPCFAEETTYVWSPTTSSLNTTNSTNSANTNNTTANITNTTNTNTATNETITTSSNTISNTNTNTNTNNAVESNDANIIDTNAEVTDNNSLNLESGSAILIEQTTGQILYAHNIHEQLRPASVTKVMSILLIMEALDSGKINLTDAVPCSENAASMGGSQIWLDPRETLTVDEMLKAICVNSANDCVVAMAEYIAGSEDAFVQQMNDRAKQLGMNDTTFKNCHGLDEDGHVTSSYDISLMSKELLVNHPNVTKYTTIWMDTLRDGKSQLSNTNKLIKNYKGATGLKTGSTSLALYNLSASATRDNLSLIAVIMKAPSTKLRFAEAQKLLDYGFNSFSFKQFGTKDEVVKNVEVNKGVISNVDIVFEKDAGALLAKGKDKNIEQNVTIDETISAPITAGQKLGEVTFTLDGEPLGSVNLVAKNNIEKINLFTMAKQVYYSWINLLREQ